MDSSPYQKFYPLIPYLMTKYEGSLTIVWDSDQVYNVYVNLVESFCDVYMLYCNTIVFSTEGDWNYCKAQLDIQNNVGSIIEILPEELSVSFHKLYYIESIEKKLTMPIYTLLMYAVDTDSNPTIKYLHYVNHYMITSSYPALLKDTNSNVVRGGEVISPRTIFAFDTLSSIKEAYLSNDKITTNKMIREALVNLQINSLFGDITFDSGFKVLRKIFIVAFKENQEYEKIDLSNRVSNEPFRLTINMLTIQECRFVGDTSIKRKVHNIALLSALSGSLSLLTTGKTETFLNIIDSFNNDGGILDTLINPLMFNYRSDLSQILEIATRLFDYYKVQVIMNLDE